MNCSLIWMVDMTKAKVGIVSLGCDKNRVDTEVMLYNLNKDGYEITADPACADVLIVNTCAFLQSARQEAIETVLEMANFKQDGCKAVVVTGCLGQKFGDEVFDALYEADAVLGINDYDNIGKILDQVLAGKRIKLISDANSGITFGNRILTTQPHVAYLKLGDGCNNFCTYCLIPYISGRFRSVEIEKLVDQARQLVAGGVKELILVAQDVTRYGYDLYGEPRLVELLTELEKIDGLEWIRLLYCYPELVTDKLIDKIATSDKVVNYIDVPLQHVDDKILKKMNRRSSQVQIEALFDKLNTKGIQIRSTFICGFPYETEQTHQTVADFLNKYNLRNVGFFPYSKEEGTAAAKFDCQVHYQTKNRMVRNLYKIQHEITNTNNTLDVGKQYKVIVDDFVEENLDGYVYVGRTYFMAPEIDGVVYLHSKKPLEIGQFVDATVTNALEYDLIAQVVEED